MDERKHEPLPGEELYAEIPLDELDSLIRLSGVDVRVRICELSFHEVAGLKHLVWGADIPFANGGDVAVYMLTSRHRWGLPHPPPGRAPGRPGS